MPRNNILAMPGCWGRGVGQARKLRVRERGDRHLVLQSLDESLSAGAPI